MENRELSKEIVYAIKGELLEHPWLVRLAKWGGVLVAFSGLVSSIYYIIAFIMLVK